MVLLADLADLADFAGFFANYIFLNIYFSIESIESIEFIYIVTLMQSFSTCEVKTGSKQITNGRRRLQNKNYCYTRPEKKKKIK